MARRLACAAAGAAASAAAQAGAPQRRAQAAAAPAAAAPATPGPVPGEGTRSLWRAELGELRGWRQLQQDTMLRLGCAAGTAAGMEAEGWLRTSSTLPESVGTVVIGCGLSGAACARRLAELGEDVLVLDARGIGGGASGRNGGLVQDGGLRQVPKLIAQLIGPPPPSGRKQGGLWHTVQSFRIERACARLYEDLATRYEIYLDQGVDGVAIFPTDDALRAALGLGWHIRPLLPLFGIETACGEQEMARVMRLRHTADGPIGAGLVRVRKGYDSISPAKAVAGLVTDALRHGAGVQTHTRVLRVERGAPHVVHTDRGAVRCKRVVYAANAWTPHLVPELKGRITPVRNHVCSLSPGGALLCDSRRGGFGHNDGFNYWMQRRDGRVVVGGFRYLEEGSGIGVGDDASANAAARAECRSFLQRHFAMPPDVTVEHEWTGVLAWSCDDEPWVGPLPEPCESEWVCAGYCGSGLWRAPVCGETVAEMVAGRRPRYTVPAYIPSWDREHTADLLSGHRGGDTRWGGE
eukprot:TRINITY_DN40560_c0_g1_i1.p1 TRINITY_DN40560_c0_g1~~TRINITY_DN40560_c0_g1_i1.p1  ORF type:complete len:546 (+),score=102.20 TRINITY_DN40560_c0_g1_i1:73-1638(+)